MHALRFGHTSYVLKIYPPGVFEMIGEFEITEIGESAEGNNMYTVWDSCLRERGAGGGRGCLARSTILCPESAAFTRPDCGMMHAAIVNCRALACKPL